MMAGNPKEHLCVALDGSDRDWILETARCVAPEVGWLKVGLEAFTAHGTPLIEEVTDLGCRVFLDLKLHDIPATVESAARNCASSGADMITVHAGGGRDMLCAAVAGARAGRDRPPPAVIAVTVLTSLDRRALDELGWRQGHEELVNRWARLASSCGLSGVVASAREAAAVRTACGPSFFIVTPGIRPEGSSTDDQRRIMTPAQALSAGADLLVIGRPVTRAHDPADAARRVAREIASAIRTTVDSRSASCGPRTCSPET